MTFLALLPIYIETRISKVSYLKSYKVLLGPNISKIEIYIEIFRRKTVA